MNKKIIDLLNEQVNKELFSAYLYQDIANYYISENLNGFGNWFTIQVQEELSHVNLFMQFLQNNDAIVHFNTIEAPNNDFSDFSQPLEVSFKHEKFITHSIYNIYACAQELKDFRTLQFLDWFVKEQGEEEKNATDLIQKYKLFGSDGKGLYMLDSELAARVYTAPSLVL